MTERYGPEDADIPGWTAPPGAPQPTPKRSPASTALPPPTGSAAPGAPAQGIPTFRSWQPGFMPLRPLQLGDFLSLPIKAITANRAVVLGGPLLFIILEMLAMAAAVTMFIIDQQDFILHWPYRNLDSFSGETIAVFIVTAIVYLITDAVARVIVIPGVSRAIIGERITLGKAWALCRPRIPQLLLFYLILTISGVAFIFAIGSLMIAGGPALTSLLILGLIPLAMYIFVFIGIAVTAIMLERIGAIASFRRTLTLMKGHSWRFIGNFLIIGIVLYLVTGAISAVTQAVLLGLGQTDISLGSFLTLSIILSLVGSVLQSIIQYSFLGSLFTLMYVDLRIRQEGFDVDLARAAEATVRR